MTSLAIDFRDVFFQYETASVLTDINVRIQQNEYIGIFGPNGGGKTTFLQLIMGFLSPQSGSISIFGMSPKKARNSIGYVPQRLPYDRQFPISAIEVVLLGSLSWGRIPKKDKEKAKELLNLLGMLELQDEPFGNLSGGEAQRVLIARSLMGNPKLLLLDEPTANVDPAASQTIKKALLQLKGKMTILHVTHQLSDLSAEVNRMLCFQNTLSIYTYAEVCEHFAHGLYHGKHEDLP